MDEWLIHTALTIIGITLVYAVLARGLLYATEPSRTKCLDLYEKIVKSHRADPETISRMDNYLDEIYSNRAAWELAFLVIFAVFIALPYRKLVGQAIPVAQVPDAVRADFDRFTSCWILATVANSPGAAMIFSIVGIIGIAFFVPFNVIAKILSSRALSFHHRTAH